MPPRPTPRHTAELAQLSDTELVRSLERIVREHRAATADMLAHLIEVDRRQLHLAAACSSLFTYCTEVLGLSEGEAYDRIHAARAAKRFPAVLDLLVQNKLHLTAVRLLAPHLDDHNHVELLSAAAGKTKRQILQMVADLAPKPDAPARIRKRPSRQPSSAPAAGPDLFDLADTSASSPPAGVASSKPTPTPTAPTPGGEGAAPRRRGPCPEPLGGGRHKVEFTATQALVDKLELCRSLMSHRKSGCEVADVLVQAVELLYAKLAKERFAIGAKPRRKVSRKRAERRNGSGATVAGASDAAAPEPSRPKATRARHVPADARREVVERDGLRCAFADPKTGRRCSERSRLELQHHEPFALGGAHSADNLSIYCHAHNQWAARRDFGSEHISAAVERARGAP